jgi:endonuclease/exonuclease/phosphatase family metal-dependent hydrolase
MEKLSRTHASIKVMTVNTHKGFTPFNRRFILPELRRAVRTLSADVVFLQEVLGEHHAWSKRHSDRWPHKPQYEFLADTIWHSYAYGRNAVYPNGHHGNALLSKYPIHYWENRDISLNGIERRGLLYSVITLPDSEKPLHTVCVHLSLREEHRMRQLKMLQALVQNIPASEPLIVAGDFNDWLLHGHRFIEEELGLHEVFSRGGHKPARTFPAAFPVLRLDRIYTRLARSVTPVVLPNRPWSHLSDHKPLLADIIF